MCGRYYIAEDDAAEDLRQVIEMLQRRNQPSALAKTAGEVFPTDIVPVIANNRRLTPSAFAMRWGYALPGRPPVINARSETAATKALFRDGMAHRRCLIPASHYFEWEKRDGKAVKYAIRPERAKMLYLAGLYRLERQGGVTVPAFAVLTREASPTVAFIHHRMPVILPREVMADWLNDRNDAAQVLQAAMLRMECCIA